MVCVCVCGGGGIAKKRNQPDFAKSTLLDEISLQKQIFGPHALFLFTV